MLYFLFRNRESWDSIMSWLNSLAGSEVRDGSMRGHVVNIISWQVVSTGRPYEYSAVAQVEVTKAERG